MLKAQRLHSKGLHWGTHTHTHGGGAREREDCLTVRTGWFSAIPCNISQTKKACGPRENVRGVSSRGSGGP